MDLNVLLLALPVFFLLYSGVGMLLESRRPASSPWGTFRKKAPQKSMQEVFSIGSRLGFNKTLLQNKKFRDRLDLLLIRSGHVFGWKPEDVVFYKEVSVVVVALLL